MTHDFRFSFENAEKIYQDLEHKHDSMLERINKILDSPNFFINNFPVLRQIIALDPDVADLKKLAKALERLAELRAKYTKVNSQFNFIKTVKEQPDWIISSCADFSHDVDIFINEIQENH